MRAIIAMGSNMGDRQGYLEAAQAAIEERVGHIAARSSVMETKAYGYTDQDDFLNMAVEVETEMEPHAMLRELLAIEADLDRVRLIHWGPRTIDLDVIYCEDRIINDEELKVPHPDLVNREFVLRPVSEIAPELVDPLRGKKVEELLAECVKKNRPL
jgi:2-amino-4-hydroxy-6-hydroxymethyldihydropteridine diphosphokinase